MPINVRQVDNVDTLPPPSNVREIPPWQSSPVRLVDWRGLAVLCLFLLFACPLAWWLIGGDIREWITYGWGGRVVVAAFILAFFYALGLIVRSLALVEQPGGFKVAIWNAHAPQAIPQLIEVQQTFAATPYRGVAAQTISYPQKFELPAPAVEDAPPLLEDVISLIPDTEWLPWLVEMPHTMIAGATGTGKTTLARIELYERMREGYAGIVLDPKGKEWFGLPVVGGGREFTEILMTLDQLHTEMAQRFKAYNEGERHFEPIKVLIDEVPDIMDACLDMRRRLVDGRWSRFVRQLGSLAREIGISVTLMTQSPLVEDIGMNSAMRKNFTRIALGDEVPILIREEGDPKRKTQLKELLRNQQYPAAMLRRGSVHLLNTNNVKELAARQIARPLGWSAPQPKMVVSAAVQASPVVRASVRPTSNGEDVLNSLLSVQIAPTPQGTDGRTDGRTKARAYLKAMAHAGKTREFARARFDALGMEFSNHVWTEVRKELGLSE
jgi:hypothetical protein